MNGGKRLEKRTTRFIGKQIPSPISWNCRIAKDKNKSLESKISSSYPREVGTLSSGLHPGAALVHFSISHGIKLEEGRTKPSRTGLRVNSGKINPKTKTRWLGLVILDGITPQYEGYQALWSRTLQAHRQMLSSINLPCIVWYKGVLNKNG